MVVSTFFILILSIFVGVNQCDEITSLRIGHYFEVLEGIPIDRYFFECIFILRDNAHQNQHILKCTHQHGEDQHLAIDNVEWDVHINSAQLGEDQLVLLDFEASAKNQ